MSSRILPPKEADETSPIAWRPVGSGVPVAGPRPAIRSSISEAVNAAEARLAEVEQQSDARVKAAFQQGHAAAESVIQQRLDPVLAGLSGIVGELASLRKRFRAEAEQDTVKLAIAIARRVLHRELSTDPDAILGILKAAFDKLNARETHRLRVSPQDGAAIGEHRARLGFPPGLEIIADAQLGRGSVIFETERGALDASVETQLSEIDRGFTDLMKRRA